MTLVSILALVVVIGLPVLIVLTRFTRKVDARPDGQVEQEMQGVGADKQEKPEGEKGTGVFG